MVRKKLSNAVMQTKVINCNIANKSCLLQLVHTKAIAASTQFCDFLTLSDTHLRQLHSTMKNSELDEILYRKNEIS